MQGSRGITSERQPWKGQAVSASGNPEIQSQALQSHTPNAKRETETILRFHRGYVSLAACLQLPVTGMHHPRELHSLECQKQINPFAISPALCGLCMTSRDPFQPELLHRYLRAASPTTAHLLRL